MNKTFASSKFSTLFARKKAYLVRLSTPDEQWRIRLLDTERGRESYYGGIYYSKQEAHEALCELKNTKIVY